MVFSKTWPICSIFYLGDEHEYNNYYNKYQGIPFLDTQFLNVCSDFVVLYVVINWVWEISKFNGNLIKTHEQAILPNMVTMNCIKEGIFWNSNIVMSSPKRAKSNFG